MIELPDHFREQPNSIAFVKGRSNVQSFVANLLTGISDLQNTNSTSTVAIEYDNLPSFLRPVWEVIRKHPKVAAVVLGAIALWAQHLHESYFKHQLTLSEIEKEHASAIALEELRHKNGKDIEMLKHELELERSRLSNEKSTLQSNERKLVEWLESVPQIDNAEDDSIDGVLRVLSQFLERFNELNRKLQLMNQAHKINLLMNSGNATNFVVKPENTN